MLAREIEDLIALLARLPGMGPRSARRAMLHLMRHKDAQMRPLAEAMARTADTITHCGTCGNLDTADPCHLCANPKRDPSVICVVEDVSDLWAIERSRQYQGLYHVLGGTLSALDGRGPDQLNIAALLRRAGSDNVTEVILATNATVEGQTTAHYLSDKLAGCGVRLSRLAQGIPFGGELDYLDDGTLGAAFRARLAV